MMILGDVPIRIPELVFVSITPIGIVLLIVWACGGMR